MPELPEVETIARQLNGVLPGKVIAGVEIFRDTSFQGDSLKLVGKRIEKVGRKQKIVEIHFSDKGKTHRDLVLLIHLKMTGQLIFQPVVEKEAGRKKKEERIEQRIVGGHPTADWVGSLPSTHTRVMMRFSDGSELFFNDQRVFGWMRLVKISDWMKKKAVMPPDVVDDAFTFEYLTRVLSRSQRAVKLVILDQAKMGGMGNIYACDALNIAMINPKIPSNQLKSDAVKRLYQAMKQVLFRGIELGGASYSTFVGIGGMGGSYQDQFRVYDREGEACKTCGTLIKKIKLAGRGTYWCSRCQAE